MHTSMQTIATPARAARISIRAALALASALCALCGASAQQTPPAQSARPARLARGNVYWLDAGGGGNAGFAVGDDGVIVVDTMTTAAAGKNILAEIAKITAKPFTTVILTHSDIDHVGGLAGFPSGLTIIAHENNKKELEAAAAAGQPAPRLPNKTFSAARENLSLHGVKIQLLHFGPAHTSGDVQVYFPDQRVVFTGDVIATSCCGNARSPQTFTMIKAQKNGSVEGWIKTVRGILALNADIYVPGHGDLQTRTDLQQRLARVQARREQIRQFIAQGKSLEQTKAALGETGPPPGYDPAQFPDFSSVVYNELSKKR